MAKIIGLGNALVDVLATLKDDDMLCELQLPKGSMTWVDAETLQKIHTLLGGTKTKQVTGGSAGNCIRALAHLGTEAGFAGKVGDDDFGRFYRDSLQACGAEAQLLTSDTHPSGIAVTLITPDGERTFADHMGAAGTLSADDLTPEMFQGYDYLLLEGYLVQDHALMERAAALAREAGLQICMDLASFNVVREEHAFFSHFIPRYVDILFANEEEAQAMTNKAPEDALEELSTMCRIVVVKVGAQGSLIRRQGEETVRVEALAVPQVVDTTGAGDFFAAGFLHGLTQGYGLSQCGRIGSLLSSQVIQVIGTELPVACWADIHRQLTLTD